MATFKRAHRINGREFAAGDTFPTETNSQKSIARMLLRKGVLAPDEQNEVEVEAATAPATAYQRPSKKGQEE